MKALFITFMAIIGFTFTSTAQTAEKDLSITGKYHIDKLIAKGKFHLWATISNSSKSDYKDVIYRVEYFAEDGTAEGSKDYTYHDYVGPGTSKKIKDQYIECPKDCKSIVLSIAGGTKLD